MKATKPANIPLVFLALLQLFFLISCEIEDEHGTPEFVFGFEKYTSQHGDMISDSFFNSEFFINEQTKEIYFVGCTNQEGWCENQSIISINYENGNVSELYALKSSNSSVQIVRNQPIIERLLFTENRFASGLNFLYEIDLATHQLREIFDNISDEYSVSVSKDFVFYHYEYDSLYIMKSDFEGQTELLGIRGHIIYALPDAPEILIQNPMDGKYRIYNYEMDSVVFEKVSYSYPQRYYSNESEIFYLDDYYAPSIKSFKTDIAIYYQSREGNFMDFNPICGKVVFMKANPIDQNAYYQPMHSQLVVEDLDGNIFTTPVNLYDEWIDFAKILNDGTTIFYVTMEGKLYQTTVE